MDLVKCNRYIISVITSRKLDLNLEVELCQRQMKK